MVEKATTVSSHGVVVASFLRFFLRKLNAI